MAARAERVRSMSLSGAAGMAQEAEREMAPRDLRDRDVALVDDQERAARDAGVRPRGGPAGKIVNQAVRRLA